MGENFPRRIKQRRCTEPRFDVLLVTFLCFQVRRDNDQRSPGEKFLKQNRKKRLRRLANAGTRQHSAILQSPRKGLHSGSLRDVSEQVVHPPQCYGGRACR